MVVLLPVGGQQYYHCGADYYRAAYQDDKLVYVTTKAHINFSYRLASAPTDNFT
jgi:hypothetical protein